MCCGEWPRRLAGAVAPYGLQSFRTIATLWRLAKRFDEFGEIADEASLSIGEWLACRSSALRLGGELRTSAGSYRSGQTGQTVNLMAYAFAGSNPALPNEANDECSNYELRMIER